MIFSLIVPTVKRTWELGRFLKSVRDQKLHSFKLSDIEIIVIDQNADERLAEVTAPFIDYLTIIRIKVKPLGLSSAKNDGIKLIRGRYVAFPDDDCFYSENTLEKVRSTFTETKDEFILFGRAQALDSDKFLLRYPSRSTIVSGSKDPNVFLGIAFAQFYTAPMIREIGGFDLDFGIGGRWGSAEDTDFPIRALKKGIHILFNPDIKVFHPLVVQEAMSLEKVRKYAEGFGALCRKQNLYGEFFFKFFKQLAGFFLFSFIFKFKRAAVCWTILSGRTIGFLTYQG